MHGMDNLIETTPPTLQIFDPGAQRKQIAAQGGRGSTSLILQVFVPKEYVKQMCFFSKYPTIS